jgi:hypothetical protein
VIAQFGGASVAKETEPPNKADVTSSENTNKGSNRERRNAAATPSNTPEPPKPVVWTAEGEPPVWMELASTEIERQDELRIKLRETVEVDFEDTPLDQVLKSISGQVGIDIQIDAAEFKNAGANTQIPVSVKGTITIKELLRRVIVQVDTADLDYIVRESCIEVTTVEAADSDPQLRYYDLAFVLPNSANADAIIAAIQNSIDPDSWMTNGGTYSISVVGSMLIVSAAESSHDRIEKLLSKVARMNRKNLESAIAQPTPATGGMGGMAGGMGAGLGGGMGGGMF